MHDDELIPDGLAFTAGPSVVSTGIDPTPIGDAEAERLFKWQQDRRRPDGQFTTPVGGFGSRGRITLWLPSPAPSSRTVFRDGEPVVEDLPGALSDPDVSAMRDAILSSFVVRGPVGRLMRFTVDVALIRYSARVIKINYDVTDADLTMLHEGTGWIPAMTIHAVGGQSAIDRMRTLASRMSDEEPIVEFRPVEEPRTPQIERTAAQRPSWRDWRGWIRRWRS